MILKRYNKIILKLYFLFNDINLKISNYKFLLTNSSKTLNEINFWFLFMNKRFLQFFN